LLQARGRDDDQPVAFDAVKEAEGKLAQQEATVVAVENRANLRMMLEVFLSEIKPAKEFLTTAGLKIVEPIVDVLKL
jgi:hypothetical protein